MRTISYQTIMLINDLADTRSGLRHRLEEKGYRVVEETNLRDAMEDAEDFTRRERPDLILLGLRRDELEAVRFIRQDAELCDVPIVALCVGEEVFDTEAVAAGCNRFVPRSIGAEQLANLVGNLLPPLAEAR